MAAYSEVAAAWRISVACAVVRGHVMRATFQVFESYEDSWEVLLGRAAEFVSQLGRERVISISHCETIRSKGIVVVWYWEQAETGSTAVADTGRS
jgi:hypothetical protein